MNMNANNAKHIKTSVDPLTKGTILLTALTVAVSCIVYLSPQQSTSKAQDSTRPAASPTVSPVPRATETPVKRKLDKRQRLRAVLKNQSSRSLSKAEVKCALEIAYRESRYNPGSVNRTSGARGVYQLLHGQPQWDLKKQVQMATKYMKHRYGTWCKAYAFHIRNDWW